MSAAITGCRDRRDDEERDRRLQQQESVEAHDIVQTRSVENAASEIPVGTRDTSVAIAPAVASVLLHEWCSLFIFPRRGRPKRDRR